MNNIEILEEFIEDYVHGDFIIQDRVMKAIEKLMQENKESKEKFDVMRRKIYRLEEDNIELLKPKGKDQLNYKYIECPKVEAEWYKSESYIEENYIPKSKIKEKMQKDIKINEHVILGGRRNGKTLEYGKRLGRIEICEELLEEGE